MKIDCEHRTDLEEKIIKDPVEDLEAEISALKAEYLELQKKENYDGKERDIAEAKKLLVSKLFELVSMYHEIGKDVEAHRVYGDILHYDESQAAVVEAVRAMNPPDDSEVPEGMTKEDYAKYKTLIALTAAAGEGAYSKSDLME